MLSVPSPPRVGRGRGGGGGGLSPSTRRSVLAFIGFTFAMLVFQGLYIPQNHMSLGFLRRHRLDVDSGEDWASPGLHNLIIVAGHAVFTGQDLARATDPGSWYLEEYQKAPGQVETLVEHIRVGVKEAAKDPAALLLFSGGETRRAAGPRSEGQSYWAVADAQEWFGEAGVRERAHTEEHARDSYENVIFSLCRFHDLVGAYPANVTVVGYDFKRKRFEDLHRWAVGFPSERFRYVGTATRQGPEAAAGERNTMAIFAKDPYGCRGVLRDKRKRRNPFANGVPYHEGHCPALQALLAHCGPRRYNRRLPWDPGSGGALQAVEGWLMQKIGNRTFVRETRLPG